MKIILVSYYDEAKELKENLKHLDFEFDKVTNNHPVPSRSSKGSRSRRRTSHRASSSTASFPS